MRRFRGQPVIIEADDSLDPVPGRGAQRDGLGLPPALPLYTAEDARACFRQLLPVRYDEPLRIGGDLEATFHDAGHILGSAMIEVKAGTGEAARKILFSGDIGRWDKPIIRDPTSFEKMDYILVESTYGDRNHSTQGDIPGELAAIVNHPGCTVPRRIRTSAPPAVSPKRINSRFIEGLLRTARTLEPHREVDDRTEVESDPTGRTRTLEISLELVNEGLKPARQDQ